MADMYGAVLSNDFKVRDLVKFKEWLGNYYFGDETEVFSRDEQPDGSATVCFGSDEQYPFAYPRYYTKQELTAKQLEEMELDEDALYPEDECGDEDIEEVKDLNAWARELRQHLMPKEIFYLIAGGNEKLRYVLFQELIIAEDIPDVVIWENHCSDDQQDFLRKRFYET